MVDNERQPEVNMCYVKVMAKRKVEYGRSGGRGINHGGCLGKALLMKWELRRGLKETQTGGLHDSGRFQRRNALRHQQAWGQGPGAERVRSGLGEEGELREDMRGGRITQRLWAIGKDLGFILGKLAAE